MQDSRQFNERNVGRNNDKKEWTVEVIKRQDTKPAVKMEIPKNIGAFNTPTRK